MRGVLTARIVMAATCALFAAACGGAETIDEKTEIPAPPASEPPAEAKTAHAVEEAAPTPETATTIAPADEAVADPSRSPAAAAASVNVAAVTNGHAYQACAACHLPNAAGVPGAFPPLGENIVAFASSEAGRAYLAVTLRKGIIGAIDVGGQTYRGAMPAQYPLLDDEKAAATLNYILYELNDAAAAGVAPFTAAELAGHGAKHADAKAADLRAIAASSGAAAN